MLDHLNSAERVLLLRFVCSFAWVDGEVSDEERGFVRRLMSRFSLAQDEVNDVEAWLLMPPNAPDPASVPQAHRRAFLEAVRAVIFIDGKVDPAEQEQLDRLREMLP